MTDTDTVFGRVISTMDNLWGNSETAFNIATQAMQDLGSFRLDPISVTTVFNTDDEWWHVQRPVAPIRPDLVFDPNYDLIPAPPTSDIGGPPSFDAPPTFDDTPPVLPVRQGPGPFDILPPVGPPALDTVVVPDAPVIVLPDFPTLLPINVPLPPNLPTLVFQGVRPDFAIAVPPNTFGFNAEPYSSALVDKIKARLSIMIDGQPGLSDSAARQMRDRAYSALDIQGLRAEQETIEAFASRGFSQPDGVLNRSLQEIRQNNQNERNKLARDVYLKDVDVAVEDFRFAAAQCIALEDKLMQNTLGVQQLMLEADRTAVQLAIEVANAQIALANLELQQFQADATVFRELVQAALVDLEIYKGMLQGQQLIGELNQQNVSVYAERVRAVLTQVEIYKSQMDGAKTKSEVNLSRVSAFSETVKAYAEQVKAYDTQWSAFGKELEADLTQYRRYELATQVFGTRVKVWGDINTNKIDQKKLLISARDLDITAYKAELDKIDTVLRVAMARLDATKGIYASDIEKYRAEALVEQIVSEGNARPMQLFIEQETQRVGADLKNAQLRITQAQETAKLLVGRLESVAQVGATLSAGLASAMHVQAGVSASDNTSHTYSTNLTPPAAPGS